LGGRWIGHAGHGKSMSDLGTSAREFMATVSSDTSFLPWWNEPKRSLLSPSGLHQLQLFPLLGEVVANSQMLFGQLCPEITLILWYLSVMLILFLVYNGKHISSSTYMNMTSCMEI
jgi:hypothetical protein